MLVVCRKLINENEENKDSYLYKTSVDRNEYIQVCSTYGGCFSRDIGSQLKMVYSCRAHLRLHFSLLYHSMFLKCLPSDSDLCRVTMSRNMGSKFPGS